MMEIDTNQEASAPRASILNLLKMNSALVTRGSPSDGAIMVTKAVFLIASAAFHFWCALSQTKWLPAIPGLIFAGIGFQYVRMWLALRRGRWRLEWDRCHVRISDGNQIDYDGDVRGMHQIDQDGRGYFLYPTSHTVFRLRRGRSSEAFETLLNVIQAEQVTDGKTPEASRSPH